MSEEIMDAVDWKVDALAKRLDFLALTDEEKKRHCVFCGEEFGPNVSGHINCGGRLLDVYIPGVYGNDNWWQRPENAITPAPTDHTVQPHELVSAPTPAAEEDGWKSRSCEGCGAKPGEWCIDVLGYQSGIVHESRKHPSARPFTFHRKGHEPEIIPMEQAQERFAKMLDRIEELEAKWINITVQMPEKFEAPYLVSIIRMPSQFRYTAVSTLWRSGWGNVMREEYVTHWQPLPTPPQSRQEVKDGK